MKKQHCISFRINFLIFNLYWRFSLLHILHIILSIYLKLPPVCTHIFSHSTNVVCYSCNWWIPFTFYLNPILITPVLSTSSQSKRCQSWSPHRSGQIGGFYLRFWSARPRSCACTWSSGSYTCSLRRLNDLDRIRNR